MPSDPSESDAATVIMPDPQPSTAGNNNPSCSYPRCWRTTEGGIGYCGENRNCRS